MPGSARRVTSNERAQRRSPGPGSAGPNHHLDGPDWTRSGELPPRFPITKQGYDRAVVDQRLAELEQDVIELDRELANLQASTPLRSDAAAESQLVGEQISAILIAAHESAEATRRLASAEADRRIAEAESRIAEADSRVRSVTEDASRELTRLQDEMASLQRERDRLLDDIRSIADRLRTLADNPAEESPAEPVHEASAHPNSTPWARGSSSE